MPNYDRMFQCSQHAYWINPCELNNKKQSFISVNPLFPPRYGGRLEPVTALTQATDSQLVLGRAVIAWEGASLRVYPGTVGLVACKWGQWVEAYLHLCMITHSHSNLLTAILTTGVTAPILINTPLFTFGCHWDPVLYKNLCTICRISVTAQM